MVLGVVIGAASALLAYGLAILISRSRDKIESNQIDAMMAKEAYDLATERKDYKEREMRVESMRAAARDYLDAQQPQHKFVVEPPRAPISDIPPGIVLEVMASIKSGPNSALHSELKELVKHIPTYNAKCLLSTYENLWGNSDHLGSNRSKEDDPPACDHCDYLVLDTGRKLCLLCAEEFD